ncbi:MAG: aspartate aminotransferase family protein [Anaerolineae bacterium]|nr:aspartate aminotransferase family protein [Anaerolineae bacterium]
MPSERTRDLLALSATCDADFNPAASEIVVERAMGAVIVDTEGRELIDLSDIIANVGHCHPRQVEALQQALTQMMVGKSGLTNPPRAQLAERMVDLTPDNLSKVYFVTGGGEAVDWSIRIARRATGKHEILSFWGGVYGRTYANISLNGLMRRRRQFGPVMPGVLHAPYPYCYRCPFGKKLETCDFFCIDFLDAIVNHASTGDIAALIIEPYQGVGGLIFPPDGYLPRLQAWAEANDIVFILDEIQSSFGRTGQMFALEWENLRPDMLCVGKGMGSGISIAALLAEDWLWDALDPGELGGGNGGNPLACTSALVVIDILQDEGIVEHTRAIGAYLLERFRKLQAQYSAIIGDVRGKGLALALEFVRDPESKEPYPEIVRHISRASYERGVYIGSRGHILDVRPPLVISQEQAQYAADVIESELAEAVSAG